MSVLKTIPRRRQYFAPGSVSTAFKGLRTGAGAAETEALEGSLAAVLGLQNPVAVASGRVGLRLLLETSGLDRGAEILVPGYTFGLVYPAIRASGFEPVAVDIDARTFQMDAGAAGAAVTPRTGAVLATHIFGEPCDMDGLGALARSRGLLLIEDCAQAMGARRRGVAVGTIGAAGFGSFDISKPLQGIRGGVVFSRDAAWMERVRRRVAEAGLPPRGPAGDLLRGAAECALVRSPLWRVPMLLFGLPATQKLLVSAYRRGESSPGAAGMAEEVGEAGLPRALAGIVRKNLDTLGARLERRRALRTLYHETLRGAPVAFQETDPADEGTAHMVVARVSDDVFRLRRHMALRGMDLAAGAEVADDCLRRKGSAVEKVFNEAVSLPIYCKMSEADVRRVSRNLTEALKR